MPYFNLSGNLDKQNVLEIKKIQESQEIGTWKGKNHPAG